MRPILIGSEIYRGSSYGPKHPLAIPRVSTTLDLIRALGWVAPEQYLDSPRAAPRELERFHSAEYIAALMRAEENQSVSLLDRERFRIGVDGYPSGESHLSFPLKRLSSVLMDDLKVAHKYGGDDGA
jgi:acetoin utilization protein AcuC